MTCHDVLNAICCIVSIGESISRYECDILIRKTDNARTLDRQNPSSYHGHTSTQKGLLLMVFVVEVRSFPFLPKIEF